MRYLWFPNVCRICEKSLPKSITNCFFCQECYETLPWNQQACLRCALPLEMGSICGECLTAPLTTSICFSPFIYKPPISYLITQLKFYHQLWCGQVLGLLLASKIEDYYHGKTLPEAIIPIPLHRQRLRQRGFNQAVQIAKPLSRQLKIPLYRNDFIRHKYTEPQSELTAAQRKHNISAAFSTRKKRPLKYVAVLDDVITTGQTLREFSKTLKKQGINEIDLWSCARAI